MPTSVSVPPVFERVPDGSGEGRWGPDRRHPSTPSRARAAVEYAVIGLLAFVPMLATKPGVVSDDTKTYLYIDPGRHVRQAVSLWDPNGALGTVTHQNIGYLFPTGPFYWLWSELHVPVWVAQRLWMAALLFAAGAGVLYLCRTLGLTGTGRWVAALAYMFTPYVLQYAGRISVILMPWSGLPWMLAFVILALRRPGWKYPALFAIVIALVSGINATAIIYVLIGPALWLPYAVIVRREATWREIWTVVWRTGLLIAGVSLWWVVGLQVEAAYGVNVLKYSETIQSTSSGSSPVEALRGLGYWFFYGTSPQTGNWTQAAVAYTQNLWLIGASLLIPTLAFLSAAVVRWRNRSFFIVLMIVGTVLAVGPFPYKAPTGVGALLKAFMQDTTAGLALRSTDRAGPIIILPLAVLLGSGVSAACRRVPRRAWTISGLVVAVIAAASVPLWATGDTVVNGLTQPDPLPASVLQAASTLNKERQGTRVYALPGNDFAAYRWGDTIDSVYPGLLTRPFTTHSQQPMGSLPTADLQEALDTPLQEGTFDPRALAPIASLMSVGDVLLQYDQQYERYGTPAPKDLANVFTPAPPGLGSPTTYGRPKPNLSSLKTISAQDLSRSPQQPWPAPLASYPVDNTRPIVRSESTANPLIVAGNGAGLTAAASVGLLAANPTIFYSGSLDTNRRLRTQALARHPSLVVTDTNAKQGYRWVGITQNAGPVESATSPNDQAYDPTNSPLDIFPGAPANAYSTTVYNGVASITASSFGSPNEYDDDLRPAAAMDGSTKTAWEMGQLPQGQWWEAQLAKPTTVDSINLSQIITPRPAVVLDKVTLLFDYTRPVTVDLTAASRTPAGQTIRFSPRTFSLLRITVDKAHGTPYTVPAAYQSFSGLSEVRIPGVTADEAVSMPQDLLRTVGTSSARDPLTFLMTRLRSSGYPPRGDYELNLARQFWTPTTRSFDLTGQVRLSPQASDQTLAQAVGQTGSGANAVLSATSSSRLTGNVQDGALAAIDGDPNTAWQTDFGPTNQDGAYVQYQLGAPLTVRSMNLQVLADGRHSVPTRVTVSTGGASETVPLPTITDRARPGSVVDVPVTLPQPLTGSTIRVTVDHVRTETTTDQTTLAQDVLPVGIAELGIPGLVAPTAPAQVPSTCRDDLLTVDGAPVWTSVQGSTTTTALARQPFAVSLCGPDAGGLTLAAGNHALRSTLGSASGFDVDQLALASAAGGAAATVSPSGQLDPVPTTSTPRATVSHQTSTSMTVDLSGISARTKPFEFVLGESINSGWQATTAGYSLGASDLVDGFANGWKVDPALLASGIHDGHLTIALQWAPQSTSNIAVVVSAIVLVLCVVLVVAGALRRRRRRDRGGRLEGTGDDGSDDRSAEDVAATSPNGHVGPDAVGVSEPTVGTDPMEGIDAPADDEPALVASRWSSGEPLPWRRAVVIALLSGLVAGLIAAPVIGLAVAAGLILVLRRPRGRLLLGVVAVACLLIALVYVVIAQGVSPKAATGAWPSSFGVANGMAWAALAFLGADAVAEQVLARYRAPATDAVDSR